eukprot:CAMPEP_0114361172 /NCGR_PEP_ID=MMETSP0101-20121206/24492_1 /TAXON_ID=38822 ORGANISM="Pteridomonas danica, Strain PT" /NCGR_SAMPLE_ID=MMETSP0101 /ASSEMBLY_ACC=CAM_ASM_000211 /LENGTH=439 /DNA_ID=CAMNT_0001505931 /DNA_START=925 /DNA_END=2240 /DNA_ORIENTATION=+
MTNQGDSKPDQKRNDYMNEQLLKDEENYSDEENHSSSKVGEFEYPSISFYVIFCLMINCQALGFGTTVSFTGPTLDDIAADLNLCGNDDTMDDDSNDDAALCDRTALVAAIYAIGAIAGAILAGPLVNHPSLGRRPVYLMNLVNFMGGYLLIGLSQNYAQIVTGRLITGFASGVSGVVTPMYVSEISPPHYRGILGSLFNIGIASGILGVNVITYFGVGWRQLAYFYGAIPQGIILISFLREKSFPESPEHLTSIAVDTSANEIERQTHLLKLAKSLQHLHQMTLSLSIRKAHDFVDHRIHDSQVSLAKNTDGGESIGFMQQYGWPLFLALGIVSGFALSAVNCLSALTGDIFELAGVDPGTGNVAFAAVQLFVAILGVFFFYEKFGRKTLLLYSTAGCASGHFLIFAAFAFKLHILALIGAMVFIGSVSIGLGALSWV